MSKKTLSILIVALSTFISGCVETDQSDEVAIASFPSHWKQNVQTTDEHISSEENAEETAPVNKSEEPVKSEDKQVSSGSSNSSAKTNSVLENTNESTEKKEKADVPLEKTDQVPSTDTGKNASNEQEHQEDISKPTVPSEPEPVICSHSFKAGNSGLLFADADAGYDAFYKIYNYDYSDYPELKEYVLNSDRMEYISVPCENGCGEIRYTINFICDPNANNPPCKW